MPKTANETTIPSKAAPALLGPSETGSDPDLTLKGQRQRKVQLAHEASLLNKAGRTEELQRCLEQLLEIAPNDPWALYNLGSLAYQKGEKPRAERLIRQVILCDPDYVDAYQVLGDIHYQSRHLLSAIEIYEKGLRQIPTRLPLLTSLLRACATMRSPHRVESVARRILNIDDRDGNALNHLAWAILSGGGDMDDARQVVEKALELKPDAAMALALGECLAEMSRDPEQARRYRDRLDGLAKSDWLQAYTAADTFISVKRADRAASVVREYLGGHPEDPSAHRYLAVTLMQDGDFTGGHAVLRQIMDIAGDRPNLQMVYCLNAFRLGDLETFFQFHHTRWTREGAEALWTESWPEWDGKPVQAGKLLVQCEQGVGDYVMFAVCFPAVKTQARDVILKTMPRLQGLFQRSFPEFQVISHAVLPPDIPEDAVVARAAAGDLPSMLGGDIDHLPGKGGILVADPVMKQKLRRRYEEMFPGKRLIGISWRSGNRDSAAVRSLDLPYWKPLFDLPDCAFISLQYGDNTRDMEELKAQLGDQVYWDLEINPMGDMDPFTAQISAMDMVISVDNSTVHFAGGLGKPCWAMLPLNSDWRWQTERSDTVWYDSVELFRPDKESGWDGLIDRVARRLAELDGATLKQAELAYLQRAFATMVKANRVAEAEQYARMLLSLGEQKAQAMRAVARAASSTGRFSDAVAILHRAMELDPADPEIQADLALATAKSGEAEMGLSMARQLTRRFPKNGDVSIACGQILTDLGRYDEATDFFARVLRHDPDNVPSRLALAALQAAQAEYDLALSNYRRVVSVEPSNATAHTAAAEIQLRLGNWPEGWREFRWRFGVRPGILPPHLAAIETERQPKSWTDGNLRKQRLLLTAERHIAEQLLFSGLLPEITKESRRVVMECDARLLPVMAASFPTAEVLPRGSITEAGLRKHNIQIVSTLGDLARRFRAADADFAPRSRSFLTADPSRVAELRQEYQSNAPARRLVGLAWRHGKLALPLDIWLPLMDRPDLAVVALNPGSIDAELSEFAERTGRDLIFDRRLDFSRDLGDYAAQIQACDFVIAVEDMAAVLAGAMGKPTIKIKKSIDHWWWGTGERQCRWFPALHTLVAPDDIGVATAERAIGLFDSMMAAR
jgi:tetratricopeptide (TPR) repeat protein